QPRQDSPPAPIGAFSGYGEPRSHCSPASASSTTPNSNAAPSPARPHRFSTPSHRHCNSTTPNEPTCSISHAPPTASPPPDDHGGGQPNRTPPAPACTGHSKRSPTASPSSATHNKTCWPPTHSAASSTHR